MIIQDDDDDVASFQINESSRSLAIRTSTDVQKSGKAKKRPSTFLSHSTSMHVLSSVLSSSVG